MVRQKNIVLFQKKRVLRVLWLIIASMPFSYAAHDDTTTQPSVNNMKSLSVIISGTDKVPPTPTPLDPTLDRNTWGPRVRRKPVALLVSYDPVRRYALNENTPESYALILGHFISPPATRKVSEDTVARLWNQNIESIRTDRNLYGTFALIGMSFLIDSRTPVEIIGACMVATGGCALFSYKNFCDIKKFERLKKRVWYFKENGSGSEKVLLIDGVSTITSAQRIRSFVGLPLQHGKKVRDLRPLIIVNAGKIEEEITGPGNEKNLSLRCPVKSTDEEIAALVEDVQSKIQKKSGSIVFEKVFA